MATSSDYDYPIDMNNIRILQTLNLHQSDVTCCDFAVGNDFLYVVTGSGDKLVQVCEWIPGNGFIETSFSPLVGHKYGVTSLQVSPQSTMLISASIDGSAILWKLQTGEKIYSFAQENGNPIRVCRFSPNGIMVVTAGDNGAICIWDLVHRSLIRTIIEHEGIVQAISFTHDSLYLISCDTLGVMNFWSVDCICDTTNDTCHILISLDDAHDLGVLSCDFAPVVEISDDTVKRIYTLATSGNDHTIKIWKIMTNVVLKGSDALNEINVELVDFLDGHESAITSVKYNIDGNFLVSASLDKTCRVWNMNGDKSSSILHGHNRYVNCCNFSKNNQLLATGSNDKTVIVWDLTGCMTVENEFMISAAISNFRVHLQENAVAKLGENKENDMILLQKIENIHLISINCCDINKDMILATGSSDKTIKLFQFNTLENSFEEMEHSPLVGHTYSVNQVEFSKINELLISCSLDGSAIIWNYQTGEPITKPDIANDVLGIRTCRISYDNQYLVTAGDDEKAVVYDLENMKILRNFEGHSEAITSVALTKDSTILATVCSGGELRLWPLICDDFTNNCLHVESEAHDLGVQSCDFSEHEFPIPNVNIIDYKYYLLATCGNDSLIKLWKISLPLNETNLDYSNIEVIKWRTLVGHGGNVNYVRFSPHNGEIICSVATDRQARIWSPYSSACLYVMDHESMITSCAFPYDCSLVITTCLNRSIWVWKLPQKLVFQNIIANRLKQRKKDISEWTTHDVIKWLRSTNLSDLIDEIFKNNINGIKLLRTDEEELIALLKLDDENRTKFLTALNSLKIKYNNLTNEKECVPYEFLCPITQEIMRDPVKCSDGQTYERSAIEEWFSSGKITSPMTNEEVENTELITNDDLKRSIEAFINL